jgi:hypothetical protein
LPEPKQDETFKVVDRRLFTDEGELRKDIAEQQDREHHASSVLNEPAPGAKASASGVASTHASNPVKSASRDAAAATQPAPDAPKRSSAFESLIRSLGQNAALLLGGYPDPRTGQPILDLDGAREMIDMLDALREKARGNMAPEEETMIIDVLGNLKLAFMEMTKATAAAAMQDRPKSR